MDICVKSETDISASHGSCPGMIHSCGASHGRPNGPASQSGGREIPRLAVRYRNTPAFAQVYTHNLCTVNKHTHTQYFLIRSWDARAVPSSHSVSTSQTTVIILDKHPQNTSTVTLPNWEIIYFPTADLMNDPLGEPTLLLHLVL